MEVVGAGGTGPLRFAARHRPAPSSCQIRGPSLVPSPSPRQTCGGGGTHISSWDPVLYAQSPRPLRGPWKVMGIEGWERRPRPQRLPPGLLLPSAPGVCRCRPAWAAGSWKEGALSGAGEVGWGDLPPSFLWRGVLWRWRRNLNRPRGNVSGEEERPGPGGSGTGEVGRFGGTPGSAECGVHGQITQVSKVGGQDSGPWSGASQASGAPAPIPRQGSAGPEGAGARPPGAAR